MPRIGDYNPGNPLAPFIQPSPGPVSAPNLPDAGANIWPDLVKAGNAMNDQLEQAGRVVNSGLGRIAGAGIDVYKNIQRHANATQQMHTLYNNNAAGAAASTLVGNSNTNLSNYTAKNMNNVDAYSDENNATFLDNFDKSASDARTKLVSDLQKTKTGGAEALNTFDTSVRSQRNALSKGLDTAKYNAMKQVVANNDADMMANLNQEAAKDLPTALLNLDSPANQKIMIPAGTYHKLSARKDELKMSNFSALKAQTLNENNYIPENGNLYVGAKLQLAAAKDLNKNLSDPTNLLVQNTNPKVLGEMQSQAAATESAMTEKMHTARENNNLHYDDQGRRLGDLAIRGATPDIRLKATQDFDNLKAEYERLPLEDKSPAISSYLSSTSRSIATHQENKGKAVEETNIYNQGQREKVAKEEQTETPETPENKALYKKLEDGVYTLTHAIEGVKNNTENIGHAVKLGTHLTAADFYKVGTALEQNKNKISEAHYNQLQDIYSHARQQVMPVFRTKGAFDKKNQITGKDESLDNLKAEPLDPNFAEFMNATPGGEEYTNIKTHINDQLDRLNYDTKLKSYGLSARQWKNQVMNSLMENRYKVKELPFAPRVRTSLKLKKLPE
jgi:hypothetical protein